MAASQDGAGSDGIRGSIAESVDWFLLRGQRGIIAGITALLLFVLIGAIPVSGLAPLADVQPLFYVFSGLLGGNITLITVVVSINQLLLSRELNRPNELRSQIEGVIDFRHDVEDVAGQVPPVEPPGFLRLLIENTRKEAQQLGGLAYSRTDDEVYDEIDAVVTEVTSHADEVDTLIQKSDASTFTVLSATLFTNYARNVYRLNQIRAQYGDRLPGHVRESIDELIHHLQDVDIARQYFKTIYLQEELASLSRLLFYIGLPSVTVVIGGLLLLTASGGTSLSYTTLSIVVPAIITVGLLPLVVLFSVILRVATVAKRTAATMPFTTPGQDR